MKRTILSFLFGIVLLSGIAIISFGLCKLFDRYPVQCNFVMIMVLVTYGAYSLGSSIYDLVYGDKE